MILGPMISPLTNSFSLYYQLVNKEITPNEYWNQVLPYLVSILTPTEVYIFNGLEKYGMYVVGAALVIFWIATGSGQKNVS